MSAVPDGTFARFRKGKEEPPSIICVGCEKRVPLWDEMEQCFASPEIQQRVRNLQEESAIVLSNQSQERALVGEVISTVGQASRLFLNASGVASEPPHAASDAIRNKVTEARKMETGATPVPLLLAIRNAEGEVRWMEVRDWLKRASDNGRKPVKQIVFAGERFDV